MDYCIQNDKIIVNDTSQFNIEQILNSGQVFRFSKEDNYFKIVAKNLITHLKYNNDRVIIKCSNIDFAVKYFDLERDYAQIKSSLSKYKLMNKAIAFGEGIRILNQDPLETIISFIISANNNIPRIKSILNRLCDYLGEDMGGYKAFPTLNKMAEQNTDFYRKIGAGYRAEYIVKTLNMIKQGYDLDLYQNETGEARQKLMSLPGIGRKVADCILLFGYHKEDVFPVDTWCTRIYRDMGLPECKNNNDMATRLTNIFNKLSGYAQQYLYYYYRENNIK